MQNEKGAPGRGEKKKNSHTQDKKCAGRKRCLNKNDAYDSPASARSSARSRSASTMANLRATCYKRYIHTRFLTCIPFLLFGDLAASEKFGGGETTRHWRLVVINVNAIGRVMGLDSLFMRSKSADELIKIKVRAMRFAFNSAVCKVTILWKEESIHLWQEIWCIF